MNATNYISTTVKILEEPRKKRLKMSMLVTEVRAQVSQVRSNSSQALVCLTFWGNLGQAVSNYYRPNDYLIVEGYISMKTKKTLSIESTNTLKHAEITVFKVYPFLLKSM